MGEDIVEDKDAGQLVLYNDHIDQIAKMSAELSLLKEHCEYMREQINRSSALLAKIKMLLSPEV